MATNGKSKLWADYQEYLRHKRQRTTLWIKYEEYLRKKRQQSLFEDYFRHKQRAEYEEFFKWKQQQKEDISLIRATIDSLTKKQTNNRFDILRIGQIFELDRDGPHFHIPVQLTGDHRSTSTTALLDSGATATFIHPRFVKKHHIRTQELPKSKPLYNVDGSQNSSGNISKAATLTLTINNHKERVAFLVADIGPDDIIIGHNWIGKHNPSIDWAQGELSLTRCPNTCDRKHDKDDTHNHSQNIACTQTLPTLPETTQRQQKPCRSKTIKAPVDITDEHSHEQDEEQWWNSYPFTSH